MFRLFNFQPAQSIQDHISQFNWQTLTDNSKATTKLVTDAIAGGQVTGITPTATTTVVYDLFNVYYGPLVFVQLALYSSNFVDFVTTTAANTVITINLPTPAIVQTGSAVRGGITFIQGQWIGHVTPAASVTAVSATITNISNNTAAQLTFTQVAAISANELCFNGWYVRN